MLLLLLLLSLHAHNPKKKELKFVSWQRLYVRLVVVFVSAFEAFLKG